MRRPSSRSPKKPGGRAADRPHAAADPARISRALLDWYRRAGRRLPWRDHPEDRAAGSRPDPYRVWLSEIMLQQTRVATVIPYFHAFVQRWPDVDALADAPIEDVMEQWAGLGYYARARNLHACAREISLRRGGRFPGEEAELRSLPGIGRYTAAAIAAIAFDAPTVPVDGNVERVMARLHGVEEPLPGAIPHLRSLVQPLANNPHPGDFAQALMDLGATVCTPGLPDCRRCPLETRCEANRTGLAADLPKRAPKPVRHVRFGVAYLARRLDGRVWLSRRPPKGLLGGMLGLPGTEWSTDGPTDPEIESAAPFCADWRTLEGAVRHVFTHFELRLRVRTGVVPDPPEEETAGRWVAPDGLEREGLPRVMRKAVDHGLREKDDKSSTAASGPN